MNNIQKTFEEWEAILNPSEVEALTDYGHKAGDEIWANEVFENIVEWNGGIATAYHIKRIISRVYGIELGN